MHLNGSQFGAVVGVEVSCDFTFFEEAAGKFSYWREPPQHAAELSQIVGSQIVRLSKLLLGSTK